MRVLLSRRRWLQAVLALAPLGALRSLFGKPLRAFAAPAEPCRPVLPPVADPPGFMTTTVYESAQCWDRVGHVTTFVYDPAGGLLCSDDRRRGTESAEQ
jgi:YD repeat-containing protein